MSDILSRQAIRDLDGLNEEAIQFYLGLAEKRLMDTLDTKKQLDQKAFILLSGYILVVISLFQLAFNSDDGASYFVNGTALILCAGVGSLFASILIRRYGTNGRHPADWLHDSSYLTVKTKHTALIYAYVLHDYIDRIEESKKSNASKVFWLNAAIGFALCSTLPFIMRLLYG